MTSASDQPTKLRVADLRQSGPTYFVIAPDAATRAALATELGAEALRKLRFAGDVSPRGKDSWVLTAELGATAVQACVVTLDPVTTRIDTPVIRTFVPPAKLALPEAESETEMPEDDTTEPLSDEIDLAAVMAEALSLALPAYPRKPGAEMAPLIATPEGAEPLSDDVVRPFAGLAALRDKMGKAEDKS